MKKCFTIAIAITIMANGVFAKPAMRDVPQIDDALMYLGLADEIRNKCPEIKARYFKAVRYLYRIQDTAREMGYTDAQIDAYRKSDAEKKRLKAKGKKYLKNNGVSNDNPQSYCALGRKEIKKSSQIGALLKVN